MGAAIQSSLAVIPFDLYSLVIVSQTGATAWTPSTSPISVSGSANCVLLGQDVSDDGSQVYVYVDATAAIGAVPGNLTLTDSVNSVSVTVPVGYPPEFKVTGTVWHVAGAIPSVASPTITQSGTAGITTYYYQIIAKNALGSTIGATSNTNDTGYMAVVASTATGFAILSTSNFNVINWTLQSVPGATLFDVLKWSGSAWVSLFTNLTATTCNDKGTSTSAYSVPTTNTTANGSDSNTGKSWASAFITLAHASSVAVAGDLILIGAGTVHDTVTVAMKDGVKVKGAGIYATTLTNLSQATTATEVAYRFPSNAAVEDFTINCSFLSALTSGVFVPAGCVDGTDAATYNCTIRRIRILGNTDGVVFTCTGVFWTWLDCILTSKWDLFVPGGSSTVVNIVRGNWAATSTANIPNGIGAQSGYWLLRESSFTGTRTDLAGNGLGINVQLGAIVLAENCTFFGTSHSIQVGDSGSTLVAVNCRYNDANKSINAAGFFTATNAGVMQYDPAVKYTNNLTLLNLSPVGTAASGNVSGNSGSFASNGTLTRNAGKFSA